MEYTCFCITIPDLIENESNSTIKSRNTHSDNVIYKFSLCKNSICDHRLQMGLDRFDYSDSYIFYWVLKIGMCHVKCYSD